MPVTRARLPGDADLPVLKGDRFVRAFQATVDGILGVNMRRVYSTGTHFYNRDRWTFREFVKHFCAWCSKLENKGKPMTEEVLRDLVAKANEESCDDPYIVIAATPNHLPLRTSLALQGGAAHEAWHTYYSERDDIHVRDVAFILDLWDKIPDWSRLGPMLLEWSNIIEDIRIERNGIQEFPGTKGKMHDLQNYILDQEEKAREERKKQMEMVAKGIEAKTGKKPDLPSHRSAIQVIPAMFRDVGLGYNNERQRRAIREYKEEDPVASAFVLEGPLTDILRESINLGPEDKVDSLRLAMEVAIVFHENQQEPTEGQDPDEGDEGGEGGDKKPPQKASCPNCGSHNVKLRKHPDLEEGQGLLVCLDCEYEQIINVNSGGGGGGGGVTIEAENPEDWDSVSMQTDDSACGGGGEPGDEEGEGEGSGSGSASGDEEGEGEGSGSGSASGDEEGEGEGSGSGSASGDEEGEGSAGGSEEGKGDKEGQGQAPGDKEGGDQPGQSNGGKNKGGREGGKWSHFEKDPPFWQVAQQYLDQVQDGYASGLLDNNAVLGDGVQAEIDKENQTVHPGEQVYRPADRTLDTVEFVKPSSRGKASDEMNARMMTDAVRKQASYLLARLRNIVIAMEQTATYHGLKRGKGLSERHLVDTVAALRANDTPRRAYYDEDEQVDTSLSAVVVMDESSSMSSLLQVATQAFITITDPLDRLGCPTMAIGFRNGQGRSHGPSMDYSANYHRYHGTHIDVFKTFGERFSSVMWRFSRTTATGGTPMADGIQYALEALSDRPEAHRAVFVVTDGCPGDRPVVVRQIRLAKESGIHLIGVGVGPYAAYVKDLFHDHVYAKDPAHLPMLLANKLNRIMDFRGLNRGRRYKGD